MDASVVVRVAGTGSRGGVVIAVEGCAMPHREASFTESVITVPQEHAMFAPTALPICRERSSPQSKSLPETFNAAIRSAHDTALS
ncbi:hypothetical protein GCM10023114_45840 [Mycolicibacterium sediminis]|uniref:Uncharacterized protein n=1 Tax=Mycolicibacterium sediminis TaxID=1286180 RepID=A0A7I7QMS8_9MYCO|nr:hypothetical protein MSEDJ_17590 [Mycolicibacterium sediminis]